MIQFSSLSKALLLCACLITQQTFSQEQVAVPVENKVLHIKRLANSGNLQTGSLSKNLYKLETIQVPYTEQVPYQVDETYTVEVPYQVTETYVETVPYEVQVPYTDYETDYRDEQRCENVTRYREECRNEQKCYLIPGNPPQKRCENQKICRNVPYTEQQCRYVRVPYQRPVTRYRTETRYRQETRTRTVTRYRTETRTRTVTKYREEQRCCRPETREVFDRQLQFQVEVHFPVDADLTQEQTETLDIILVSADQNSAQVRLQQFNTVYNYTIAGQTVSGGTIQVVLAATPKSLLSEQDLASLSDFKNLMIGLDGAGVESELVINDLTNEYSDVTTEYAIYLDLKTASGNKPLNMRSFTRDQLKIKSGHLRMADVIQNPAAIQEALIPGNTIIYSVIAKRGGASPFLAGKVVKAQKLASVVLK